MLRVNFKRHTPPNNVNDNHHRGHHLETAPENGLFPGRIDVGIPIEELQRDNHCHHQHASSWRVTVANGHRMSAATATTQTTRVHQQVAAAVGPAGQRQQPLSGAKVIVDRFQVIFFFVL
jgi:hypothetical protein